MRDPGIERTMLLDSRAVPGSESGIGANTIK
jgi:hypothetical protein